MELNELILIVFLINLPFGYMRSKATRFSRRDMKVASQIAEYATPSIWGNPTVTCIGSNAGV